MSPRPTKPERAPSLRGRKFAPPGASAGPNVPVIVVAVAAVVVVGTIVGLLLFYPRPSASPELTPSPTLATAAPTEPLPGATSTSVSPVAPATDTALPPTLTPRPTTTATPIPEICQAQQAMWVRAQPTEESTGIAQLSAGDKIGVIGQTQDSQGELWYLLAGYAGPAYVQAEQVQCPAP